jgi:hypothetical protein
MRFLVRAASILAGVFLLVPCPNVQAADTATAGSPDSTLTPHNGVLTRTKQHVFETVFLPSGVCVYLFDAKLAPMMMQRVKAVATVTVKGAPPQELPLKLDSPRTGEKTLYFCPMHPSVAQAKPGTCEACGGMELIPQDCIRGGVDLSSAAPGGVTAAVTIKGMKGTEPEAAFTVVWPASTKK